uniref:Uncharacterized protein n=1 Tax=Setaria viridis TaxID=4556 RepID=A0A4U6VRA1_SETVI|nr:hypothetical protein SEVIR_2G164500v2 [Setaria viridis]
MKESCIVLYSKSCVTNPCMYYIVDVETPEGEFLDLSEEPSEFEEIVELIPCEASPSGNANIFTDQELQQESAEEEAPKN